MALATVTTTFDLADYFGTDFDARRAKAWATTNIDNDTVHDTSTGDTRIGGGTATIATDGTGSFTHWAPGADGNPTSWQTTYHFDVPDRTAPKGRRTESFGPFTVTTSGELTALVEEQEVPPTYLSTVIDLLDTYVGDAEAARDLAEQYRDEAHDVSGISTPDGVVEALINDSGSDTSAALAASFAAVAIDGGTP